MGESSSVISSKKVTSAMAAYIWGSPCLKPLVFNPFVLSIIIVALICLLDFLYGKKFKTNSPAQLSQHIITSYFVVAICLAMNNVIIKHKYRLDKFNEKNEISEKISEEFVSEYIEEK